MNNETKTRDRFIILLPGFCYYCLVGNSFLTSAQHEGTTQTHSWIKNVKADELSRVSKPNYEWTLPQKWIKTI
jgi:hypothetical protein